MGLLSPMLSMNTMASLCRQMATSYEAGIPVMRSLNLISGGIQDKKAKKVLNGMHQSISQGSTLGQAARKQEDYLPEFFIQLLSSGEMGGRLDVMLRDLATYYEDRVTMRRQIIGACIYPGIQLGLAWFLGTFALRLITSMRTQGFSLDGYLRDYLAFQGSALLLFGTALVILVLLIRAGVLRRIWSLFTTHVWPFSMVTRRFALARFFRSLSLLLSAGLPVQHCIEGAVSTVNNYHIEQDLLKALPAVMQGHSLVEAFAACRYLTPTAREMLHVGEESGRVDAALQKVAQWHMEEASHAVRIATRIAEITIMLAVGAVIGYIIVTFYGNLYGGMLSDLEQ